MDRQLPNEKQYEISTAANSFNLQIDGNKKTAYIEVKEVTWKDVYPQVLCALTSFLFNLHVGSYLVYTNLFLMYLDTNTASQIVSLGIMMTALGVVISGPICDKFGRKNAHFVMSIPCVSSWLIFAIADISQIYLLLTARLLGGLTTGLTITSLIYVSEIAHKNYRAMFLSFMGVFGGLGTFLISILASFLDWRGCAAVFTCIFVLVTLSVIFYIPETPFWLINFRTGKTALAKQNLEKLNLNKQVVEEEWAILMQKFQNKTVSGERSKAQWSFFDPIVYKPTALLLCLIFCQQMTGSFAVLYYAKNIISLISPTIFRNYDNAIFILFGTVRFVSNVMGCIMAKKVGRRVLLIGSACGMAVPCLLLITLLSGCLTVGYADEICLALFMCFIFATGCGVLIIPWTISPELLPPMLKGIGSSVMIGYSYLVSSIYSQRLVYILNEADIPYAFVLFAAFCILLSLFTFFFIPETFGKGIHEINDMFRKKSSARVK